MRAFLLDKVSGSSYMTLQYFKIGGRLFVTLRLHRTPKMRPGFSMSDFGYVTCNGHTFNRTPSSIRTWQLSLNGPR